MTYWVGMTGVLLIGYALVRWSGRENEQANEGGSNGGAVVTTGKLGLRPPATLTHTSNTYNQRANEGYNGREEGE